MIFILSNQERLPSFNISLLDFLFKKLAHIFVYAILYYLLFLAYLKTNPSKQVGKKHHLWPLLIALIYALGDEFHQSFVKGRYAATHDIAYDFLGMMSVLLYQQKML
ncbi:MAG: VanZ family protein [Candidatus Pacebacteria bacterium]|nr:VanZ family protein [Candidatus Paceibacterota bacterium]